MNEPWSLSSAHLVFAPAAGRPCRCSSLVDLPGRGRRLVALDRAVQGGEVTAAEAAERRAELLAR